MVGVFGWLVSWWRCLYVNPCVRGSTEELGEWRWGFNTCTPLLRQVGHAREERKKGGRNRGEEKNERTSLGWHDSVKTDGEFVK